MIDQRFSDNDTSKRDIPSFIEPRPPLISNPFMRPKPQKGTNLLELFEEDSDYEEPELVQVYLRLKPCHNPSNLYEVKSDRHFITSLDTAAAGHGKRTQQNVSKMYTFSRIFGPDANQKELFERIVKDNLKKLPEGHSFTLLTYGASGSGKTFTLMGTVAAPGLVPRSLEYVFKVVDAAQKPVYKPADNGAEKLGYAAQENEMQFVKQIRHVSAPLRDKYRRMSVNLHNDLASSNLNLSNRTKHYVWVSFVEIYNESIYDLLSHTDKNASSKLVIREDSNGNVYVKGATQVFVKTGEEAYDVMVAGKHNLQVAATGVNAHSSRSHCIFTITMLTETELGCRVSSMRLCDLAGCERVRRTRNAGARLAESRAINSSLHVLERCLRTLRSRQRAGRDALVPYRESKLTRLLGAGLSGARGEAVCVVVTLNPAPDCALETKHVLQLAAVAKDIQINNTASEYSSLETSQDSSISNTEVMKLRCENERLHFEILQAQSRNRELLATMEEHQAASAAMMREVVDEAKDMTKQYYESLLKAQRKEMENMKEEYEAMLSQVPPQPAPRENTPSRVLNNKISQLMREIAILEEKLTAEMLARARAEEELQHLRVCIEERDEKAYKDAHQAEEVMSLTESEESDSDESKDSCNESLEPTIMKEFNHSRLLRQSLSNTRASTYSLSDDSVSANDRTAEKNNDTLTLDKSNDTMLDDGFDEKESQVDESISCKADDEMDVTSASVNEDRKTSEHSETFSINKDNRTDFENSERCDVDDKIDVVSETVISSSDAVEEKCRAKMIARGTYFVRKSQDDTQTDQSCVEKERDTTDIIDADKTQENSIDEENDVSKDVEVFIEEPTTVKKMPLTIRDTLVSKIIKSLKSTSEVHSSNVSLVQFEQLEMAANRIDTQTKERPSGDLLRIEMVKDKKTYFDDYVSEKLPKDSVVNETSKERKVYFDNLDTVVENSNKRLSDIKNIADVRCDEFRSPSIVKEDNGCDCEPRTMKLFGESFARQPDPMTIINKSNLLKKKNDSVDVFEDSPRILPGYENNDVENIRKSINNIVLYDKSGKVAESKLAVNEVVALENPEINTCKKSANEDTEVHEKPVVNENFKISEKSIAKEISGVNVISIENVKPEVNEKSEINNKSETRENPQVKEKPTVIEKPTVNEKSQANKKAITGEHSKLFEESTVKPVEYENSEVNKKSVIRENRFINEKFVPNEKPVMQEILNRKSTEKVLETTVDSSSLDLGTKVDNTLDEFEKIYKDISEVRTTEFDLLVTQEIITSNNEESTSTNTQETTETKIKETTETKYNLRKKTKKLEYDENECKVECKGEIDENYVMEILKESEAKCESVARSKRALRLRRRKQDAEPDKQKGAKLKDIVNLQSEFSDVTLDVPVPRKEAKDIASPVKDENSAPTQDLQSCSKSVCRSRRKLFTPRAEPLDEDFAEAGGASGERVRVPRPSYQRPRARRKL